MTSLVGLIGFLLLVLAIACIALAAAVAVGYLVRTYLLPTPENESLHFLAFERRYRRHFYRAHDARRDALLEAERRRRADGELPSGGRLEA